ncbi:MAG: site-specific DNA-methyltransferase [Plesiomonas shigelloides]
MEKITAASAEAKSLDITAQNIEQLKALFPDVFSEGQIDFDALKAVLGEAIDDSAERYNFTWHGKNRARQIAQTPSTGTLRPCKEESVNWDTTENLFIEGDNLEVLKLLQKSYHRKVKMIYIDPPYNTGTDFVYKDNFHNNIKNYLQVTGQVDDEGNKLAANNDTSGRFHSDWLNMIYPRLKLARNLLKDDGVIFISIGDDELKNLKFVCDEIYSEENFITIFSRMMKSGGAKGRFITPSIEYILVYAKNIQKTECFRESISDDQIATYYNKIQEDGVRKGERYGEERLFKASLEARANQRYWIECPDGSFAMLPGETLPSTIKDGEKVTPNKDDKVWKWTYQRYQEEFNKGNIVFKKTSTSGLLDENGAQCKFNIYNKLWLSEQQEKGKVPSNFIGKWENRLSSAELKKLAIPFDFAKPTALLTYLIELTRSKSGDIHLDFFAGSGSFAHAVMAKNASDGQNRLCISVQLPEACEVGTEACNAGFNTISEITKERIRRVISQYVNSEKGKDLKLGFKALKLDETNILPWEPAFDNLKQSLLSANKSIKADRSAEDVLYEILLKYGIELTVPIEQVTVNGKQVYVVGAGALLVCLDDVITTEVVAGIAKLKQELDPETTQVVFKDAGFADSVVKTNAIQILKQAGIDDVKSI